MSFLFPAAKQRFGYAVIKPSTSSSSRLTDLLAKCVSEKYSRYCRENILLNIHQPGVSIFRTSNIVSNIPGSIESARARLFINVALFGWTFFIVCFNPISVYKYYNGSNKIRFVERNHYRFSINKVGKLHEIYENYSLFLWSKFNLNLLMHEIWILNIHKKLCPLTKLPMLYSCTLLDFSKDCFLFSAERYQSNRKLY